MSCNNGLAFFPANFNLQNHHQQDEDHSQSLLPPCTLPQDFHGFLGKRSAMTNNVQGFCNFEMNREKDYSDDRSKMGEKKKRLNMEQLKILEKNFELGNKLESDRKLELARALGLQPIQIAIWFQNRRARSKTKQLEKDYDMLKRQFDCLKDENEILQIQNQKLQAQVLALKSREPIESINLNKETEGSCSDRSANISGQMRPPEMDSKFVGWHPPTTTTTTMQFFQNSSSEQRLVKEENSINNMFSGIDDQSGFWPWLDQQHYNCKVVDLFCLYQKF